MQGSITEVTGAMPYQVYQRDADDRADIEVGGKCAGDGIVEVRLTGIEGFDWRSAECTRGDFSAVIRDVPVGGPYVLEVRLTDGSGALTSKKRVPGLLVGDIWVLAGQSNMDGYGKSINLETPSRMVHCFEYDERWHIARDPLCWVNESVDPVHWQVPAEERETYARWYRATRDAGAGLGVRFGKDLYKATGVPVGLMLASHSGSLIQQWDEMVKSFGGESFYGSMLRRVGVIGGRVAGFVWYQGESDAFQTEGVGYGADLLSLIENLRAEFDAPEMPFLYVQLGNYLWADPELEEGWNRVQIEQFSVENGLPHVAMVPTIGSTMSDHIHLDAISHRRLGAQLARQARKFRFGEGGIEGGPRPSAVEFVDSARKLLRVSFTGVTGRLSPARGIMGFTVDVGEDPNPIERAVCDGPSRVVLTFARPVSEDAVLWHGKGVNPACCLKDSVGARVPVFSMRVPPRRARSQKGVALPF